jgi:catechol 2,3-dioxygenase-like lactoylglutathione lyase family enzyme
MKLRLDRVTISVKNLEKAKRFFSDLLETTFEDVPEEIGKAKTKFKFTPADKEFRFRFAVSPMGIELIETDPPVEVEGLRNITWRVDDIKQAREEMRRKGIGHVLDLRCGGWKEAIFNVYGVRWVLNEYEGDSVFKAMVQTERQSKVEKH